MVRFSNSELADTHACALQLETRRCADGSFGINTLMPIVAEQKLMLFSGGAFVWYTLALSAEQADSTNVIGAARTASLHGPIGKGGGSLNLNCDHHIFRQQPCNHENYQNIREIHRQPRCFSLATDLHRRQNLSWDAS